MKLPHITELVRTKESVEEKLYTNYNTARAEDFFKKLTAVIIQYGRFILNIYHFPLLLDGITIDIYASKPYLEQSDIVVFYHDVRILDTEAEILYLGKWYNHINLLYDQIEKEKSQRIKDTQKQLK